MDVYKSSPPFIAIQVIGVAIFIYLAGDNAIAPKRLSSVRPESLIKDQITNCKGRGYI